MQEIKENEVFLYANLHFTSSFTWSLKLVDSFIPALQSLIG